jgi:hypothetical protein
MDLLAGVVLGSGERAICVDAAVLSTLLLITLTEYSTLDVSSVEP